MRTEKYNSQDYGDDIRSAFNNNGLNTELGFIDVIVAEVCGENDGFDWYWILQMRDGSFAWAKGGCDYTGWSCQSSADFNGGFKSPEEAIEKIDTGYDSRKNIKELLLKQIKGEIPFAIYQDNA